MPTVEALLASVARDAEPQLQQQLRGLLGGFVRAYLPQTWVFRTEEGVATLHVDAAGKFSVLADAVAPADVTVEIGHARLAAAISTRRRAEGTLTVTPHTSKGRTAFEYLRGRLGL